MKKYWNQIKQINWKKNCNDLEKCQKFVIDTFSEEEIEKLQNFVSQKEKKIYFVMNKFWKQNPDFNSYVCSDDGFWDCRAHIVGLGEKEFNKVVNNPILLEKRYKKRDYVESFLYCFYVESLEENKV